MIGGKNYKWFFKSWLPSFNGYIPAASGLPATQGLDEELPYIQPPPAECLETFASAEDPSRKKTKKVRNKKEKQIVWLFLLEVNPKVQCFPECWSILFFVIHRNARPNHIQCPLEIQQLPHLVSPSMLSVAWDMLGSLFCHSDLKLHLMNSCPMTLKPRFN